MAAPWGRSHALIPHGPRLDQNFISSRTGIKGPLELERQAQQSNGAQHQAEKRGPNHDLPTGHREVLRFLGTAQAAGGPAQMPPRPGGGQESFLGKQHKRKNPQIRTFGVPTPQRKARSSPDHWAVGLPDEKWRSHRAASRFVLKEKHTHLRTKRLMGIPIRDCCLPPSLLGETAAPENQNGKLNDTKLN